MELVLGGIIFVFAVIMSIQKAKAKAAYKEQKYGSTHGRFWW